MPKRWRQPETLHTRGTLTPIGVPLTVELAPSPRLVDRLASLGPDTRWQLIEAASMTVGGLIQRVREEPDLWSEIELAVADLWANVSAARRVQDD